MRFVNLNRTENPNAIAGLFLLILLAVFAGPNALPRLISDQFNFVYEGVPCEWLRAGEDRATHQSLIGRASSLQPDAPISVGVETNALPVSQATITLLPDAALVVTITVTNNTIGTVPIVLVPDDVILGGNTGENGLGLAFAGDVISPQAQNIGSYPENQIRLLGPRQRCVHRVVLRGTEIDNRLVSGTGSVQAFYRNGSRGAATGTQAAIYPDQGLWVGLAVSQPFDVPVSPQ
jgi:hypothetical protein